jgi:MFS family permease
MRKTVTRLFCISSMHSLILVAAFVSGFCIMSMELLGGRILAPWFGGSIYVWGSVITVFMLALALGYLLGGRWSLHNANNRRFAAILGIGGLAMLPIVLLGDAVMEHIFDAVQDPRYGSLIAASILFFLPSAILGMASPYAVRLLTQSTESSGASAGFLYFVSTLGSAVGTLATSFYLVALFEVNTILLGTIAALVLMAIPVFLVKAKHHV